MALSEPAARHRRVSGAFADVVRRTIDWKAATPVEGWVARDVVDHLVGWLPGFLASASDVRLPAGPAVTDDPVGAWRVHADGVQALLDDPRCVDRLFAHPRIGEHTLADAIDRFYTADVFMHTWDLGRAAGREVTLDPDVCAELLDGMKPVERLMRESGHYGPRVDVPADAEAQTRMLGFIGRDPLWVRPAG